MALDILKQLRRTSKKERFRLDRIASYLSKEDFKRVKSAVRKKEARVELKRLPISFLISGKNLIPQLSPSAKYELYNSRITSRHYSKIRADFSSRAYDVIHNFVAPEKVGLSAEKRVASAMLFSTDLNILFYKHGKEILDFLAGFDNVDVFYDASKLEFRDKPVVALVSNYDDLTDEQLAGFDFVFEPEKPYLSPKVADAPSEVQDANMAFIKDYVSRASDLSVNTFGASREAISKFVESYGYGDDFLESVLKLTKALVKMEHRNKVSNRHVSRALELASASVKK